MKLNKPQVVDKKQGMRENRKEIADFNPSIRDWIYLDGDDIPWEEQTYSRPNLDPKIAIHLVGLEARSYQLKWVAGGRMEHASKDHCAFTHGRRVEVCPDDKLLATGKHALEFDIDFFGITQRFKDSMCMFHFQTRVPWPETSTNACGRRKTRAHRRTKPKSGAQHFPITEGGSTDWAADRTDGLEGNYSMQYREKARAKCVTKATCEPLYVCPAHMSEQDVRSYSNEPDYEDAHSLLLEVEKPEFEFMEFADALFEQRYQKIKQHVSCLISEGSLTGQEDWFGPGCFS